MKITVNNNTPVTNLNFIDAKIIATIENNRLTHKIDTESLYFDLAIDPDRVFKNKLLDFVSYIDPDTKLFYLDIADISAASLTDTIASIITRNDIAVVQYASISKGFYVQFKYDCAGIMNDEIAAKIKLYIQTINIRNIYNRTALIAFSNDLDTAPFNGKLIFDYKKKVLSFNKIPKPSDIEIELNDVISFSMMRDFLKENLVTISENENWQQMRLRMEQELMRAGYLSKLEIALKAS